MSTIPLQAGSEPFSTEGFARLYESVRGKDPSVRQAIAQAIVNDPRGSLQYAFTLSKEQKEDLAKVSDDTLRSQAQPIVDELLSDAPAEGIWLVPDAAGDSTSELYILPSCSCIHRPL